jgi:F-type H+-transporting ATPase subunit b
VTATFFHLNATFAVELAVFVVVLAVLNRFVIKPLQAAMGRRQAEIDESLAKANRVEELLAAAEADYVATLDQARREARQIIATAQRVADNSTRQAARPSTLKATVATGGERAGV